jgi:predicted nucleic acid-binding protein
LSRNLVLEAAELAAALQLRGADSFYVATAQQLNAPLLTFDKEQRTRPAQKVSIVLM